MPGSIHISDIQPPVTTPLSLHVAVGKREYSGNIGKDGFSFPVTSLRDGMVMKLYDADKELVSKTDVNTKAIVELGTMDAVFSLDSGGTIVLQLRFLLSDEDRKRVQEMRNSVVKRKQQELLVDGHQLSFQESSLPNEQSEKISGIASKGNQLTLGKSLSLDDLKDRDVSAVVSVANDPPLQSGETTSTLEGPIDINSKKGQGKPEGRSSSAVKKMINAFETSSPQVPPSMPRIKSESSLEGMSVSSEASTTPSIKPPTLGVSPNVPGHTQRDLVARTSSRVAITSADAVSRSRPGKQVMLGDKKSKSSTQTRVSNTSESPKRRSSSRRDREAKARVGEKRSAEKHRVGTYSPEQQPANHLAASSSIAWIHPHPCITTASRQLKDLVDLEHLNAKKNVEQNARVDIDKSKSGDDMRDAAFSARQSPVLNGWLINQGVRVVIVIIACGAVFINNR